MKAWEVPALPEEGGTAREERDGEEWSARLTARRARRAEEAALRRELGLESAFGFYIDRTGLESAAAVDAVAGRVAPAPAGREGAYPCLEGRRYSGCLGLACPLERCWTGGPTISQARALARRARVSAALYLPGAPCHGCAAVVEAPEEKLLPPCARTDDVARPVGSGQPAIAACTGAAEVRGRCAGEAEARGPGDERGTEATGRVDCSRGLWAHPISLAAFVSKRIPMLHEAEPALCPGFAARSQPHPAVAAHLERRREQARLQRAEQRQR